MRPSLTGRRNCGFAKRSERISAEPIGAGGTALTSPIDQHERTDDREREQHPPERPIDVVKAAGADGKARQKQTQSNNGTDNPDAERPINDTGDNGCDDDKERPVPIFGPARAAAELNILAKA
jgi:hypothetical protein